jgi:uncharacterized protein
LTALAVFAKPPQPGLVKTRLIPDIGADRAAGVYRHCLRHALAVAKRSGLDYCVYLTEPCDDRLLRDHPCRLQTGADLGERMHNALLEMLGHDETAIVIGSDCLDIETNHLERAARALDTRDLVLLPAYDGGYALIGSRQANQNLFGEVDWSTSRVLQQTLDNASALGWNTLQLETVRDIDTLQDMNHYPELVRLAAST